MDSTSLIGGLRLSEFFFPTSSSVGDDPYPGGGAGIGVGDGGVGVGGVAAFGVTPTAEGRQVLLRADEHSVGHTAEDLKIENIVSHNNANILHLLRNVGDMYTYVPKARNIL